MNFKKIIAITASLALCAGMLTACGGDEKETENTTTTSETTVVSEEAAVTEPSTESEADESEDVVDDNVVDDEEYVEDELDMTIIPESDNPLKPLADAAVSVGEWPSLWEVTDPQMLSDFFLLDAENENYKNMMVLQCPMSANMTEIIIIESDDVESVKTDLEARRKKAQEQDAFYPDDVDKAAASIIGSEGSYAYFILAYDAAEAETALVEAIKAL